MLGEGGQWLWVDNDQEEGNEDIKKRTLLEMDNGDDCTTL